METNSGKVISTILKHDNKQTSYKIALLRAINDVVLSFPDMGTHHQDIAIPLRILAEFWLAYYWPFVDPRQPIMQGNRSQRVGGLSNDMAFRPELTELRQYWEKTLGNISSEPSDGFFLILELRISRKRQQYSHEFQRGYEKAIRKISKTIEMPIRYAGPGEWTVFEPPQKFLQLQNVIPGTQKNDLCLVVKAELWQIFRELSLWVEALCIHEWCLFTETVEGGAERGVIYTLLTARSDNRRPLTWERNNIDLLLMEGKKFICPWTERFIIYGKAYAVDHLIPISIYPINELWNLVPSDPDFNSHVKRNRMPSPEKLEIAYPKLELAYTHYSVSQALSKAMQDDVTNRFSMLHQFQKAASPTAIADAVVDFISHVTAARNLPQF